MAELVAFSAVNFRTASNRATSGFLDCIFLASSKFTISTEASALKRIGVKSRLVINPLYKQIGFFSVPFLERLDG